MTSSFDTAVNNLSELFVCKCKYPNNETIDLRKENEYVYSKCSKCNNESKQLLKSIKQNFKYTNILSYNNHAKLLLLLRKGIYPYEYRNSFDKFNETQLSSYESFYKSKTNSNITKKEYRHAKNVWNALNCETTADCHDLYV